MLFTFLLIVHAIIAAALVTVILMQRSEGGGLGMGGSPSGLMSARGAADFLTRATTVLACLFVAMSIGLAALATYNRAPRAIDTSLARTAPASESPASDVPLAGDPLAPVAGAVSTNPGPVTPEAPAGETIPRVRPAPAPATATPATTAAPKPVGIAPTAAKRVVHEAAPPKADATPPAAKGQKATTTPSSPGPAPAATQTPPAAKLPEPVLEKTVPTAPSNSTTPQ